MADRSAQRERAVFRSGPPDSHSIASSAIDFDRHFSLAEWEQIRLGLVAESLPDDRWTIIAHEGSVYFMYYFRTIYKVDFLVSADAAKARAPSSTSARHSSIWPPTHFTRATSPG